MNTNVSPEMMALLDGEMKDIQAKKRSYRNVKIEENDSWLVRYLPFQFGQGTTKPFYLKVANHWIQKRPYFCPRNSSPEVGGDPSSPCALCDTVEEWASSSDQVLRKAGFKASATQQWLMYCWVFERELAKNRGELEIVGGDERWTPWEYWHSKWGFEEFIGIFRQCANRKQNAINVLDFVNGCNFWAASTAKGISLRREDAGPLYDENGTAYSDEELQQIVDFSWQKIKPPTYNPLSDEQLDTALIKLEESTRGETRQPARRNFRESNSDDDSDLAPQRRAPAISPRAATPPARTAAPPARTSTAPSVSRAPVATAPVEDDVQYQTDAVAPEPPARQAQAPRVAPPSVAVPRPSVPRASAAPQASAPAAAPSTRNSLSERLRVRQPAQREEAPPAPQGSGASTIDNDADNVTEEQRDPAPPADVPLDDAPPVVSATGESAAPVANNHAAPRISSRLREGIKSATQRK